MDPSALVAFILLIFLIVIAVLSVAVDSAKVVALEARLLEKDRECYQQGFSMGYHVGVNDGYHHGREPWSEEFQHVAVHVDEDDSDFYGNGDNGNGD